MPRPDPIHAYQLTRIAATGDRFSDFSPYVASINADGMVAFQASLTGGGTGVFMGNGGFVTAATVAANGLVARICSHPAINRAREIGVYAEAGSLGSMLLTGNADRLRLFDGDTSRIGNVGPLGPTINEDGIVGFRAGLPSGDAGILKVRGGVVGVVADTSGGFARFHGLPLVDRSGDVLFRADWKAGGQGIFLSSADGIIPMIETGREFRELGQFPATNESGALAFVGIRNDGGSGVFTLEKGKLTQAIAGGGHFDNFRGALISDSGELVFYATPRGGSLGIYFGPDPLAHRVIGIGSAVDGSTVADFVLNPVSINGAGQLAVRLKLADGLQVIVRADPVRRARHNPGIAPA